MRIHITLEADLVDELRRRVGVRRRSQFISQAVREALESRRRWDDIEAALASIPDKGHEWDVDPADWVSSQRRGDARRVG